MAFSRKGLQHHARVGFPTAKSPERPRARGPVRFMPGVATSNVAFHGPFSRKEESMGNAPILNNRLRIGPKLPAKW